MQQQTKEDLLKRQAELKKELDLIEKYLKQGEYKQHIIEFLDKSDIEGIVIDSPVSSYFDITTGTNILFRPEITSITLYLSPKN